ncbi:cation acetate symporter [Actinobacteria bacterium YIM 96077]|uniref:Cation acetate symporter n=1 Tax=Phytoactinopolyspora halophila TaxID=1981511 RepID=A0A329QAF4_9ACTN|nr:cation acetate symporter [Phytoactinopolyspora halophila]AYY12487.1 cation acetate symporter [Actinobacteria bacterium YIM 96077]RAW09316.1 cation acetate symporter [Phytoactinopolyspora halophila]
MITASVLILVALLIAVIMVGIFIRPRRASTLDFYLAGQRVGVVTNACAICGDYFSAASFLGVAASVYVSGLDGIWYATGFAAGFVPVLLFVAAPLRRFGEFSIPDFLGRRLESDRVRFTAVVAVQLIILSYLVPQAVGSGITWELLVGHGIAGLSPYATGVVVATTVITALVTLGGMRGTTWTQAIQFLLLLAAFVWLAIAVVGSGFHYADAVADVSAEPLANPVHTGGQWQLEAEANRLHPGEAIHFGEPGGRYGPLGQFALIMTLVMGTAGLPHIMNRYFTSPTGTAARMTTVWVLGLAGLFYALAVMLGTAARALIPAAASRHPWLDELTVDGVLRVPEHALLALGRLYGGQAGLGFIATGALIAVLSTIAGLLLASAASWGHDVYERHINPRATQRQAVWAGRGAVLTVAGLSAALALSLRPDSLTAMFPSIVATMVTWAFAFAGSALTPVFILTIWWRRMTAAGAVAGIVTGAVTAITMFATGTIAGDRGLGEMLLTPTVVAAPLAAGVAVVISLYTRTPANLERLWLRLHGTAADRRAERLARLTISGVADLHSGPQR